MCILRTYTNEIIHRLPRRYAGIKKFNLTVSLNEGVGVCAHGRRHRGEGREGCMGYIVLRTFVACTPQGGGGGVQRNSHTALGNSASGTVCYYNDTENSTYSMLNCKHVLG